MVAVSLKKKNIKAKLKSSIRKKRRITHIIMKRFKDNEHIDSDIYELFIKENIPQKYAEKYLRLEQYDI